MYVVYVTAAPGLAVLEDEEVRGLFWWSTGLCGAGARFPVDDRSQW